MRMLTFFVVKSIQNYFMCKSVPFEAIFAYFRESRNIKTPINKNKILCIKGNYMKMEYIKRIKQCKILKLLSPILLSLILVAGLLACCGEGGREGSSKWDEIVWDQDEWG
jgi:hypothetical protein